MRCRYTPHRLRGIAQPPNIRRIGRRPNERDLVCKDRMRPATESASDKRRDAFMAVVRDDQIGFAVACNGKGVVSRINNFHLLPGLLGELRHQWPNDIVRDIDHCESDRSCLHGHMRKRTVADHAQRDGPDEGRKVQAFHLAQYPRFLAAAVRPAAVDV